MSPNVFEINEDKIEKNMSVIFMQSFFRICKYILTKFSCYHSSKNVVLYVCLQFCVRMFSYMCLFFFVFFVFFVCIDVKCGMLVVCG